MSAREIRWLLARVGLKQRDVANALALTEGTVSKILSGRYAIRRAASRETANRVRAFVATALEALPADVSALVAQIPAPLSPCGSPNHRSKRTCSVCHAAWMRAHRPSHADLPEPARRRAIARSTARVAQVRGRLVPQPCERCGAALAEKHHDDYERPLEVRWLCRPCHLAHHRGETIGKVPRENKMQVTCSTSEPA